MYGSFFTTKKVFLNALDIVLKAISCVQDTGAKVD